jgi:hypothetical protein
MTKILIYALWLLHFILLMSCSRDNGVSPNDPNAINISIRNTDSYSYSTGVSGDEDGTSIKTQAKHFKISEIRRNASTKWEAVYFYEPEENYVGSDHVEIETRTGSDGASPPTHVEIIMINFIIMS